MSDAREGPLAWAVKTREAFEFGYLGGPMFFAMDGEQLAAIAKAWDAHLADAVLALTTKAQLDMRERAAQVVRDRHPWTHSEHYGESCAAAVRALAARDVTP
jgi:hypothetical protein